MKKTFCLCLAAVMLLSMCACGKDDTGATAPPPAVSETMNADGDTPPETAPDQPAGPSGS